MSVDKVKSNLKEAVDILRDEELYGYRNVHDRCHFLLTDTCEKERQFGYGRND